jgi:hypothetical protein
VRSSLGGRGFGAPKFLLLNRRTSHSFTSRPSPPPSTLVGEEQRRPTQLCDTVPSTRVCILSERNCAPKPTSPPSSTSHSVPHPFPFLRRFLSLPRATAESTRLSFHLPRPPAPSERLRPFFNCDSLTPPSFDERTVVTVVHPPMKTASPISGRHNTDNGRWEGICGLASKKRRRQCFAFLSCQRRRFRRFFLSLSPSSSSYFQLLSDRQYHSVQPAAS